MSDPVMPPRSCVHACPLCGTRDGVSLLHTDAAREYWLCPVCALVHVPARWHPSMSEEKARYDQHRNDPADPGYRRFLMKLANPLQRKLPVGSRGLDFGCGPTAALAQFLQEAGFEMSRYDPFYSPDPAALESTYDFVACAEAFEHFFHPATEWQRLLGLVRPGGWLGIMTGLREPGTEFGAWWYRNDITHVCFFSRQTFLWLARRDGLLLEFASQNVVLMQRAPLAPSA